MRGRMAADPLSYESAALILEGSDHPTGVSKFVSTYKTKTKALKNPAGATWTIGNLHDTIYRDKKNVLNGWSKFYLPDIVNMQVLGVVEGTPYPCDQLVLMTCENKMLYAYDGEELHLVASSMMQLFNNGIKYPAAKSYYKGEAFKEMTNKDWEKRKKGPVGQLLYQKHHKLVTEKKSRFLQNLRSIRQKTAASRCSSPEGPAVSIPGHGGATTRGETRCSPRAEKEETGKPCGSRTSRQEKTFQTCPPLHHHVRSHSLPNNINELTALTRHQKEYICSNA